MESLPLWIVAGCWVLFVLVWIVLALGARKDAYSQSIDEREPYSIPFVASLACLAISMHGPLGPDEGMRIMFARLVPLSPALAWTGAVMALAALFLALWARLALGRNWSGMVGLKDGHELVTSGPYAAIRHPIYTALILLVLATVLMNRTALALVALVLMTLSCWIKLRAEEDMMSEAFPDAYPAYMARTRRLVPGLV